MLTFFLLCFSHICCTILHIFLSMSQMCCCVTLGCFENVWFELFQQYATKKKKTFSPSHKKERERILLFNLFFHVEWLNFTLHWHIWGDAPWNQSNSGISEEEYFWKLWRYVVILLPPALDRLLHYVTTVILVARLLGWSSSSWTNDLEDKLAMIYLLVTVESKSEPPVIYSLCLLIFPFAYLVKGKEVDWRLFPFK